MNEFIKKKLAIFQKPWVYILFCFMGMCCAFYFSYEMRLSLMEKNRNPVVREIQLLLGDEQPPFVPYSIESAVMYHYAQKVANGESIGGCDPALVGMEKIAVSRQMTLGLEYYLGWSYRFLYPNPTTKLQSSYEDNSQFGHFVPKAIAFWCSLSAGLFFLWLILLRVPFWWTLLATFLWCISPAALARYTGEEIVRGNFAQPFIILFLAMLSWNPRTVKKQWIRGILLGLSVCCSLAFWDLSQLVIGVLAVYELARILLGGVSGKKRYQGWFVVFCGYSLAILCVPYHWEHQTWLSPVFIILLPSILILGRMNHIPYRGLKSVSLLISLILLWWGGSFCLSSGNYSHFAELVYAKLVHWNQIPKDPSLIESFDARMLWTPELHSANWTIFKMNFPSMVWMWLLFIIIFLSHRKVRSYLIFKFPSCLPFFYAGIVFSFLFWGFVRYREFSVLFMSAIFPILVICYFRRVQNVACKIVVICCIAYCCYDEFDISRSLRRQYQNQTHVNTAALISWMRSAKMDGQTVLADFKLGPSLLAYCGCRLAAQPQYELASVREISKNFYQTIFLGNEEKLRDLCVSLNAKYLIFDRTGFSYNSFMTPYSPRYIAAAKEIRSVAPAYFLDQYESLPLWNKNKEPGTCRPRWFVLIAPPPDIDKNHLKRSAIRSVYSVFKVISPEDAKFAETATQNALQLYHNGKQKEAEKLIHDAILADPNSLNARISYMEICNLSAPWPALPGLKGFPLKIVNQGTGTRSGESQDITVPQR